MNTQRTLPPTSAFVDWAVPIKESLTSLIHQFENFSVPREGKAYLVTGDIQSFTKHLKAVNAFINRAQVDIQTDGVCVIQFSPDEQTTKRKKGRTATRGQAKVGA